MSDALRVLNKLKRQVNDLKKDAAERKADPAFDVVERYEFSAQIRICNIILESIQTEIKSLKAAERSEGGHPIRIPIQIES